MIKLDSTLTTDDMILATIIVMHGYKPKLERIREGTRPKVVWVLTSAHVDDMVRSLVKNYLAGTLMVDPREFMSTVKVVRTSVYEALGHRPARLHSA